MEIIIRILDLMSSRTLDRIPDRTLDRYAYVFARAGAIVLLLGATGIAVSVLFTLIGGSLGPWTVIGMISVPAALWMASKLARFAGELGDEWGLSLIHI